MTGRTTRRRKKPWRIALRPDEEGAEVQELTPLDDIVVKDVSMFRAEDMGPSWWLCCYLEGEPDHVRISFSLDKKTGELCATEMPDVAYEAQR